MFFINSRGVLYKLICLVCIFQRGYYGNGSSLRSPFFKKVT
ncbi:hypothetical protein PFAG_03218 [Plasmodium falciparum Santa Lucia]|uniref:Uncharacterized protein n=7 Tax=Plasmodium falciparum TaxID=5833 RepID=W4ISL4_PLAFP|nr:hypothetical protein PFFVO_05862 [Plasmodium falciparum Vietnam Oak-Knoll (FVO)]ETW41884.1 hypothetical protein PFNF135_03383 [Plasmodium falciparum NF135/5.C10]ETW48663.1 hypothetical protein PFMALIP_03202 [Plasmodium falciparum MaliPS096_E11]ETW52754.1 hypothetical protein PFUGPA_05061 [Plasmodium falciparum Palo Alto/Uganda]ETW60958.1 hypothetical protein PFMC_03189 [Plasmodium falciparum CAMP/Malaysia]EUR70066.1 hypothetical protein PFBG_03296 [Plasmodium falciparum 7G8]EUT84126.1 hypo